MATKKSTDSKAVFEKKDTAAKKPATKKGTTAASKSKTATATTKTTASKSRKTASRKSSGLFTGKTLIIVESPSKAKTLGKILGSKYAVMASVGHVRDLPKGRLSINIDSIDVENDHGFEPEYIQVRGKASLIKDLIAASKEAAKTYLASDPDREGEAISWHLATLLEIDPTSQCRIRMHEITATGAKAAVAEPDKINLNLVYAQQARRVLDRLVGYELSPLLWNKVRRGLSAGRVQSVALRIVCEREDEISKFVPEEYWLIDALCSAQKGNRNYTLRVVKYNGKNIRIESAEQAETVEKSLKAGKMVVEDFKVKENSRGVLPPFKTSTLQQEASRRLGLTPKRTMGIAQSLYEGVDIPGRGPIGLITYMRTDSLRLSPEAVAASRSFIENNFGRQYLPAKANSFVPKGRAQDAHEAIRATDATLTPESLKPYLTSDQFRLYDLIWKRYIASQMADAKIERSTLTCNDNGYQLMQNGITVTFDGWGKLYPLGVKDSKINAAIVGEVLNIDKIDKEQKFTQPPSRYTEAGLIKVLEEEGIGRPSTYATIIDTLSVRNYVERNEEKKLCPTKLGNIVNTFLVKHFPDVINVTFTAEMENNLDEVEAGKQKWRESVGKFWESFEPKIAYAKAHADAMRPELEFTDENCPNCGKPLVVKTGRFGEFIACSGYPDCKFSKKIIKTTGIKCPKCGTGELVRRRSVNGKMKGRFFYGCSRYPECDFVSWNKPNQPEATNSATENDNDAADM